MHPYFHSICYDLDITADVHPVRSELCQSPEDNKEARKAAMTLPSRMQHGQITAFWQHEDNEAVNL